LILSVIATIVVIVSAQDPASGWMGYARGTSADPGIITYVEAKWRVPSNPLTSGAFFSPWFGIEASDNLNLIQPVNPWTGYQWQIYNEYFQWSPEYNYNSKSNAVNPGDLLFGSVSYNNITQAYDMYHSDMNSGWSVNSSIPIQKDNNGNYKQFTIAYFVMEKSEWYCSQYPPDNKVTFFDIRMDYNYKTVTPVWKTSYVDDHCNCRAHILNSTSIAITWNSSL